MPTTTTALITAANALLQPSRFQDYAPNGLQVAGPDEISTLVTGVSAHVELFERAAAEGADMLLVHHGLFWGSGVSSIDATLRRRLKLLFDHRIALAAYHLPLDAHPEVGNNALLASALGAESMTPFALHRGEPIGFVATLRGDGVPLSSDARQETGGAPETSEQPDATTRGGSPDDAPHPLGAPDPRGAGLDPLAEPSAPDTLAARVEQITGQRPLVFAEGPPQVKTIGIVSGAGTDFMPEAIAARADALLTGEPAERALAMAREGSINFLAAGHHATETLGVRRLGERLAEQFGLRHVFIDVANPV